MGKTGGVRKDAAEMKLGRESTGKAGQGLLFILLLGRPGPDFLPSYPLVALASPLTCTIASSVAPSFQTTRP